jgi:hypothetical protein
MNVLNYTQWIKVNESIDNNTLPWHWNTLPIVKNKTKSIGQMKNDILNSIDRVMDFIQNNQLTESLLNAKWNEEEGISEMLYNLYENPDIEEETFDFYEIIGGESSIEWKQKDPTWVGVPGAVHITNWYTDTGYSLNIYWDTTKEVPIWTIYNPGDMFLFYMTHTPGNFNPSGSGFVNSYLTDVDLIEGGLLYEAFWRIMLDPNEHGTILDEIDDLTKIGISKDLNKEKIISLDLYNYPYRITNNYFNLNFKRLLYDRITINK